MSNEARWVRYPDDKSQVIVRATELNNKNIYVTNTKYYKIGQLLQISGKFIANWFRNYKLGQLLQTGA